MTTEKYDRAFEKRITRYARMVKRTLLAADEVIWETQAVGKWEAGTIRFKQAHCRLERAAVKYNTLRTELENVSEEYGADEKRKDVCA